MPHGLEGPRYIDWFLSIDVARFQKKKKKKKEWQNSRKKKKNGKTIRWSWGINIFNSKRLIEGVINVTWA